MAVCFSQAACHDQLVYLQILIKEHHKILQTKYIYMMHKPRPISKVLHLDNYYILVLRNNW